MPRRPDAPRPTAAADLAARLRARILDGELAPGTPLREEELASAYELSRHTVRTALATLAAAHLAEVVPYRGARVAALDDAALVALQQLRAALEAEAVRLLREAHGDVWPPTVAAPLDEALLRLAAAERSGDWALATAAHSAFHQALVAVADSPRITETYDRLEGEILLLLAAARPHYPAGSLEREHRAYLAAVQTRGGDAVREHLDHLTDLIRAARAS